MKVNLSIDCKQCCARVHSIFCNLADNQLKHINEHKATKTYNKHETVFHEGDKPRGLFCVFSGLVKIYKTSANGKEQIVRLAKQGDVLGYRSFFSGQSYGAAAMAISEATICYIEKKGVEQLIHSSPELIYSLLKKLCVELGESEQKFQDLLSKNVEQRLAHFINMFSVHAQSKSFELPLSREEIASLIGARPETVIRTFSLWREKGWIQSKAKSMTVVDSKSLFR